MPRPEYAHWGEEADRVWAEENDFSSPMADMTDDEIKQAVYDRMRDDDLDWPEDGEE